MALFQMLPSTSCDRLALNDQLEDVSSRGAFDMSLYNRGSHSCLPQKGERAGDLWDDGIFRGSQTNSLLKEGNRETACGSLISLGPAGPRRSVDPGLVLSLNNKYLARGYHALGPMPIREM